MEKEDLRRNLPATEEGTTAPFFSYVKQRTKSRPSVGPLKSGGKTVSGSKDMANLLNTCFSEAFTREGAGNIPEPATMEMNSLLEGVSITAADV